MKKALLFTSIFIVLYTAASSAGDKGFELKLRQDRISPGRQTELEAIVHNAHGAPHPEIPFIGGLDIKYIGSVNGPAVSIIHTYRITAGRIGDFKIGPATFVYEGNSYRSNPVYLKVAKELPAEEKEPDATADGNIDISEHIYTVFDIPKTRVFVNERLPVTLKLYTDWIDLEDITLSQKSSQTLIMNKFDKASVDTVTEKGVKFAVLEYRSYLFALTPGAHIVEPVSVSIKITRPKTGQTDLLNNNIKTYDMFIGSRESRTLELKTKQADIAVLPLPVEGQPEGFNGAVGSFDFDIDTGPKKIKLGDTVVMRMVIRGAGNYDTISLPGIRQTEGIKVYEPRAVKTSDSVTYEQAVRVDSFKIKEIPAVTFSFFDPEKGRYVSLVRGPVAVNIEDLAGQAPEKKAVDIKAGDKTGRKQPIVPLKDSPGNLSRYDTHFYKRNVFILLWLFPVVAIISAAIIRKRLKFLEDNPGYAAMLRASKKARRGIIKTDALMKNGDPKAFYENVFRVLQDYLGERLLLPTAGITEKITDILSVAGIGDDMLKNVKNIFSDCYLARYALSGPGKPDMKVTLKELKYVIDNLDRKSFKL